MADCGNRGDFIFSIGWRFEEGKCFYSGGWGGDFNWLAPTSDLCEYDAFLDFGLKSFDFKRDDLCVQLP